MKNKLIITITLLSILLKPSMALDTIYVSHVQIDSIQQLIKSQSEDDIKKVQLLNECAKLYFYDLQYLEGLQATQKAREISKKIGYKKGEGLYYLSMGFFHRKKNLDLYYLLMSDWILDTYIPRDLHNSWDRLPQGKKDADQKLIKENLLKARTYFQKENNLELVASINFSLSTHPDIRNDTTLNFPGELALTQFKKLKQTYPVFILLVNKISYLRSIEANTEAREHEIELIDLVEEETDYRIKGLMAYQLGNQFFFDWNQPHLAHEYYLRSVEIIKDFEKKELLFEMWNMVGVSYLAYNDIENAIKYVKKDLELYKQIKDSIGNKIPVSVEIHMGYVYSNLAQYLIDLNRLEEAQPYMELGKAVGERYDDLIHIGRYYQQQASISLSNNKIDDALFFNQKAFNEFPKLGSPANVAWANSTAQAIAHLYLEKGELNNALEWALKAYQLAILDNRKDTWNSSYTVSMVYEKMGDIKKAHEYLKIHHQAQSNFIEATFNNQKANAELKSVIEAKKREISVLEKEKLLQKQIGRNQRLWIFSIAGALFSVLLIACILYRNNQQKQKTNQSLKTALNDLKSTQSQLIQSEKMASLGELTAGIAHEIQNPLNFVNNFSELNGELIEELKSEKAKGKSERDEELEEEILNDIQQNTEKIYHHGNRASGIVKGMLEHSRKSDGEKQLTDINALADEYLRLSYHGLRAKDKSLNADFKLEADDSLPKIIVIPQDIGRVLLNLINNAFYAVDKRAKDLTPQPPEGGLKKAQNEYKPTVIVSTTSSKSHSGDLGVKITVKDNGPGIPASIVDKIFQPFFTTKPTGSGTGLGLSLSYDIIKAHGGELTMETTKDEGTEFIIHIPI